MKKKPAKAAKDETDPGFAPIVAAFAADPAVSRFGANSLRVNGKVFAMMVKGQFVVKLPGERGDELVRAKKGEYLDMGGRLMKEWVATTKAKAGWIDLARQAHRHARADR